MPWVRYLTVFFADYAIFGLLFTPLFLWLAKAKEIALHSILSAFSAWAIGQFIKDFFYLPRPFLTTGQTPVAGYFSGGSFPSNHTAAAFAIAVSVALHHRRFGLVLLVLASLIGLSRILGGVHYPADVVGGVVIGSSVAILFDRLHPTRLLRRLRS